jgi:hypothetical protein
VNTGIQIDDIIPARKNRALKYPVEYKPISENLKLSNPADGQTGAPTDYKTYLACALLARYAGLPTAWLNAELFNNMVENSVYILKSKIKHLSDRPDFRFKAFKWAVLQLHEATSDDLIKLGFVKIITDHILQIDNFFLKYSQQSILKAGDRPLDRLVYREVTAPGQSSSTHPVAASCTALLTDEQRRRILDSTPCAMRTLVSLPLHEGATS